MSKILFLLAQKGFQTKEYHVPCKILEERGHEVLTASTDGGIATSNIDEEIVMNAKLSEVNSADFDAIFAIGGPGALTYLDNEETVRIIREAQVLATIPYGAICIAPRIFAKAGLLKGKRVTGWNNDGKLESICQNGGCFHDPEPVVIDGLLVTANGPESAEGFGQAIASLLVGRMLAR